MPSPKDPIKAELWKNNLRHAHEGKITLNITKQKQSAALKGKPKSEKALKNMRNAAEKRIGKYLGENNLNFGIPRSEITRRKISEAKMGEKNPQWKGGISFEPYCILFNNEFKERVRAFFGYRCIETGLTQEEHLAKWGESLHVHHVNYRKESCCDETIKPLFVAIAHDIHTATNHNRKRWEQHFTEMIYSNDPTGKCFFTKEEIKNHAN
jgi:hypothetical protein